MPLKNNGESLLNNTKYFSYIDLSEDLYSKLSDQVNTPDTNSW